MRTGSASLRWLFYCGYAVVLTAVLLYVRFPAQEFKEYCTRKAEGLFNGTKCTIGKIAYAFPFSIRFDTVKFTSKERSEIVITGRTKHFLSLCGEHLSQENMNRAIHMLEE